MTRRRRRRRTTTSEPLRQAAGLALLLLAGCAGVARQGGREPETGLERGLHFVEVPQRADPIAISSRDQRPEGQPELVERVFDEVDVDSNSRIKIRVLEDQLFAEAASPPSRERLAELEARQALLSQTLAVYGEWLEQIKAVIEAWGAHLASPDDQAALETFIGLRNEANTRRTAINRGLRTYRDALRERRDALGRAAAAAEQAGGEDPAQRAAREDELRALASKLDQIEQVSQDRVGLSGLEEFLTAEIEAFQAEIEGEIRESGVTLKLEAFLLAPGKDPVALHLRHYDRLLDREVRVDSISGLDQSVPEIARMVKLAKDVAEAANAVRTKEQEAEAAFADISPQVGQRLQGLLDEYRALREELDEDALEERVAATRAAYGAYFDAVKAALAGAASEAADQADVLRRELETTVQEFAALQEVLGTVHELREHVASIRRSLDDVTADSVLDVAVELGEAEETLGRLKASLGALFGGQLQQLVQHLRDQIVAKATEIAGQAASDLVTQTGTAWETSGARRSTEEWRALAARAAAFLAALEPLLAKDVRRALSPETVNPAAFEVPLSQALDTEIDLRRTGRKPGDLVMLRATVSRGGEVLRSSESSFRVERYGWHASLDPSLVLVRPDELASGETDYSFAPALVWAWTHYPRPDEDGWWSWVERALQPAYGLHAILLNFDSENDTEVGLGPNLSLWRNRLQFGIGYNFMADDSDDGQIYYFVGSSLIPLLQALGYAEDL